jgi:hypothetical protein
MYYYKLQIKNGIKKMIFRIRKVTYASTLKLDAVRFTETSVTNNDLHGFTF